MTKHTPGPWHTSSVKPTQIMNDHGICIAECLDRGTETPCPEGNARLIAAAPDLLEACMELRDACAACFRIIATQPGLSQALDNELPPAGVLEGFGVRAQNAIHKAVTGEPWKGMRFQETSDEIKREP